MSETNFLPKDAADRKAVAPVICYPTHSLPQPDVAFYRQLRAAAKPSDAVLVPPREAATFTVPMGGFFRISSIEGPQVGDLNLWNANDLSERFYSGKTRALHGTHLTTGDRMWSAFPHLRPLATIIEDLAGSIPRCVTCSAWKGGVGLDVTTTLLPPTWRCAVGPIENSSPAPQLPSDL